MPEKTAPSFFNHSDLVITYFKAFEQREKAFRQKVHALIPRKYAGPRAFWKDFTTITSRQLARLVNQPIAWIPCTPRDCLAFATPWHVLTAARLSAIRTQPREIISIDDIAARFDLCNQLHQPVRTLSGGETVKAAMAKAYAASSYVHQLVIASPFTWLSAKNHVYFDKMLGQYQRRQLPAILLALEDEDSTHPIKSHDPFIPSGVTLEFTLILKKVRIPLSSSLNLLNSDQFYAYVTNFEAKLNSPCLITGDNGQGKSLLARVLTRAIRFQGQADIESAKGRGYARLLFQDVMTQVLLRPFQSLAFSQASPDGRDALECYHQIVAALLAAFQALNREPPALQHPDSDGRSLLEIKMMLAAVRLCACPSALILDEPDWGLTRAHAVALVSAIINVAHQRGVAVILISHKPWWRPIARSRIAVQKRNLQNRSFWIDLHRCEVM